MKTYFDTTMEAYANDAETLFNKLYVRSDGEKRVHTKEAFADFFDIYKLTPSNRVVLFKLYTDLSVLSKGISNELFQESLERSNKELEYFTSVERQNDSVVFSMDANNVLVMTTDLERIDYFLGVGVYFVAKGEVPDFGTIWSSMQNVIRNDLVSTFVGDDNE